MVEATSSSVKFSVSEYLKLDRSGIFRNQRVELIKGRIFKLSPQAHPHRLVITYANEVFSSLFKRDKFWVVLQGTYFLDKYNALEPDLHVFNVRAGTPEEKLPNPFLVIEVSHKTYKRDSGVKLKLYAEAKIQEYWIVNIKEKRIEVYRSPTKSRTETAWYYKDVTHYTKGQKITLLAQPKVSIKVSEILP